MRPKLRILGSRIIYAIKLKRLLLFLAVLLFCITNILVTIGVQNTLLPIVKSHAQVKAKTEAINDIYRAVQNVINTKNLTYSDLYTIKRTDNGNISSIEVNTPLVNELKGEIIKETAKNINGENIGVPLGDVFNNLFFTGRGPVIPIKLTCKGYTTAEVKSEFSGAGINQTRHSVLVDVKTEVNIVLPYDILSVSVQTRVPVTETVIVGTVPDLYLNGSSLSSEH